MPIFPKKTIFQTIINLKAVIIQQLHLMNSFQKHSPQALRMTNQTISPDNESNNSRPESPDNELNNSCSESPDNESNNSHPATPTTSFNNDGSNNIHLTCTTRVEIDAEHKENTHFKWLKTSHPLWSYFKWSSDKKNAYCNLCRARYGNKTGISTIKHHFERHHRTEYDRYQQSTLVLRSVEYYGNRDEKNSSDSLDFYFVELFVTNKLLILLMMTIFVL